MFTISAGGYNTRHSKKFHMFRPQGLTNYVLLLLKAVTSFEIANKKFTASPNCAILIDRNTPYQYYSQGGNYADDWLHFDCLDDGVFRNSGIVFNEAFPVGNSAKFTLYIQQILWEKNYSTEVYKSNHVDMLLQILINNLILAYQEKDCLQKFSPYYTKLQDLRLSLQAKPYANYNVNQISKSLGISASYFQHLYSNIFGTPFQSDLINMRIEYAKDLILSTNLTIEQIAEISGYSNEVHFYRQFRKKTGMTPIEYRTSQL